MLVKTSKLYNGKEHTFTTLGAATNVVLKSGTGEQFQIQGTLNIVDGPDNPADILINGSNIGSGVALSNLSDVNITEPITNGELLSYNASTSKWINVDSIAIPNMFTTNLNVSNNFLNNYSVLEVTSIQKLKCDNIRTGLTNCLLLANNAERIIPGYTDLNLNLTNGFLSLNTTITATTLGTDCAYRGSIIKSTFGGTGNANSHGFVNTTTDDIHCDQDLSMTSEVGFALVNGLEFNSENYTGDNFVTIGQGAGIIGSMKNTTIIGNQAGYFITSLDKATILGDSAGYEMSGSNITLLGYNVSMSPTSSTNIIMIGNSIDCDIPTTNLNNYFVIRGTGDDLLVDPVIETYNMNDKTIMATTIYGKTNINLSKLLYNGYNITFTTQLKFDQSLVTTASPLFNDLGLYDLSLTYPMYLNTNETLSASRTLNLKCLDSSRDLTFGANLTVNSNYISYATQYLSFTGNTIKFGTDSNCSTGRIVYASPTTLTMGSSYIGVGTQYINFSGNSIAIGTDSTNFGTGKITFGNPCNLTVSSAYIQLNSYGGVGAYGKLSYTNNVTLQVDANSYINQDVRTSGTPKFSSDTSIINVSSTANINIQAGGYTTYYNAEVQLQPGYGDYTYDKYVFLRSYNTGGSGASQCNFQIGIFPNTTAAVPVPRILCNFDTLGNFTLPQSVNFQAYLTSDASGVTGESTSWTMAGLTSVTTRGNCLNTSNGIFSSPTAGIYEFSGTWTINNIQTANTECYIKLIAGGTTYNCSYLNLANLKAGGSNSYTAQFRQICKLALNDTVYTQIAVYNYGSKNINIISGLGNTNFSGRLIA